MAMIDRAGTQALQPETVQNPGRHLEPEERLPKRHPEDGRFISPTTSPIKRAVAGAPSRRGPIKAGGSSKR